MAVQFDEHRAGKDFEKENPQPERPEKPSAVEGAAPMVVRHQNGGLWMQARQEDGYRIQERVEICFVVKDKAILITITPDQFEWLKTAVEQVGQELGEMTARAEKLRQQEAAYEDDLKAWREQRERYIEDALKKYYDKKKSQQA